MEKIKNQYNTAIQTLQTLKKSIDLVQAKNIPEKYYSGLCDSKIQRFKYSIDNFWKFLKVYLSNVLQITIEATSPRAIIREALNANVITSQEFELLMKGIIRRNERSHAYNKELASEILKQIPQFYDAMHTIINKISTAKKE